MQRIKAYTLIDITNTGVVRNFKKDFLPYTDKSGNKITTEKEWLFARRQERNYETLLQILSLRIQPMDIDGPFLIKNNIKRYKFGKQYKTNHPVWMVEFGYESTNALATSDDPIGLLASDCNNVPMMIGLLEGGGVSPYIDCSESRNTYFIQGND